MISANGARRVVAAPGSPRRPFDCFYVYPSLSGPTNDLKIDQAEKQVVVIQASRFGLACRVFAPLYRQDDSGIRRRARRLARLPRALERRPRRRADRPLAGRLRPRAPDPGAGRAGSGGAEAARLGDPARRRRDRGGRLGHGRHVPDAARLPPRRRERLCRRLLDLEPHASAGSELREPSRGRGSTCSA